MRLLGTHHPHPGAANENRTRAADLRYHRRGLHLFVAIYLGALMALAALGGWPLLR